MKKTIAFFIIISLLILTIFYAILNGSIGITGKELLHGLFNDNLQNVNIVKDLRFPRIIIALLVGAALGVSGLLLQTSLRNPLLDPSIIGVSSGASLFLYIGLLISPNIIFYKSLFSIIGGLLGFCLIYIFARTKKSNVTIILIGIAISSFFNGLIKLASFFENTQNSLVNAKETLSMKSWEDVKILLIWLPLFLLIAILTAKLCNIFFLDDNIIKSLGINVQLLRLFIALLAVVLASIATSVAGIVAFLALLTPHIAKIIVGKNHIYTIPFTALMGAFIYLLFDTIGRIIFNPIEIPADIIMLVVGGPCFLLLIMRGGKYE